MGKGKKMELEFLSRQGLFSRRIPHDIFWLNL
jgi:hypothetical protein